MLSNNIEYRSSLWGFLGTLLWGIVIVVALGLGQLLILMGYMLVENSVFTEESFELFFSTLETDSFLLFLASAGGMLLAVPMAFGIAKLKRGSILKDYFSLNGFSWKSMGIWLVILIVVGIATGFLTEALGAEEIPNFMMELEYPTLGDKLLLIVAVSLVAPLVEEVVFRGFLLKGFSNSFMGIHGAVLLTSAVWAMIHMQYEIPYLLQIFIIGIVFGYARLQTNSLFVPMIMHSLMNFVSIMGLFYEKGVF